MRTNFDSSTRLEPLQAQAPLPGLPGSCCALPAPPRSRRAAEKGRGPILVCRIDSFPKLEVALEAGADAIEIDLLRWQAASKRHSVHGRKLDESVAVARSHGCAVVLGCETSDATLHWPLYRPMVEQAVQAGADALLVNDLALLLWTAGNHPALELHLRLSRPTEAVVVDRWRRQFGITRVVLPPVVAIGEVARLARQVQVELEVFGYGAGCAVIGFHCRRPRRRLPQATEKPVLLAPMQDLQLTPAPSVIRCAGSEEAANDSVRAGSAKGSGALRMLPRLIAAGVRAIKLDLFACSPAEVKVLVEGWRREIDACCVTRNR